MTSNVFDVGAESPTPALLAKVNEGTVELPAPVVTVVPAVTEPEAFTLPDEAAMLPAVAVMPVPAVTVVPAETVVPAVRDPLTDGELLKFIVTFDPEPAVVIFDPPTIPNVPPEGVTDVPLVLTRRATDEPVSKFKLCTPGE